MKQEICISVYTCAFPPKLECGGGCALRYYTMVKNMLLEQFKVVLFTVHPPDQVIAYDPIFQMCAEQGKLIIEQIPSKNNSLYPQIALINPKISHFKRTYQVFKKHDVQVLVIPDTCETLPILDLWNSY